jgi:peptidoglycan/xylan/chitin deacetylase (PgdA/CDA1 family)
MNAARATLADARRRAAEDARAVRRDPSAAAHARLGRFSDAGVRDLLLRRLALRAHPLAKLIEGVAFILPAARSARLRAFAAELAYWQTARARLSETAWADLTRGPVVLMYHAVATEGEPASRYVIARRQFERHIRWLRRRGYCLMTLDELVRARRVGLPPGRVIVLTFDDGYADNAGPLLALRVPATIFVPTAFVGRSNEWDAEGSLRGRELLEWDALRELRSAGVEIGGHSRTHPALPTLSREALGDEVLGALADLRRELGPGGYTFAYPHGRFDAQTQAALAETRAGGDTQFVAAACSRGGVNDPAVPHDEMRRVEIKGTDSFLSFALMVELGRRITPGQLVRSLLFGT